MGQKTTIKKDRRLLKLKYWREVAGLKQSDFATLLGCKAPNYSQKEAGKAEIRLSEMLKLQAALNETLRKQKRLNQKDDGSYTELTLDDLFR